MVKIQYALPKLSFLFFVAIAMLAVVPALFAESIDVQITEDPALIAEIPAGSRIVDGSVQPRPSQEKIAYVYESEEGFKVCLNIDCGPYVDRVARGMPVVSPNGKHVAAVVQKGGDARVMLGGAMSEAYDRVYDLRFSPDSMILAYIAQKDDAFFVYLNQDRQQSFAAIDPEQGLVFSRDSNHLAYVASGDGQSWHLVKNGEPGPAYEQIKHVTFSPDSKRLAYAAKKEGKWHLVEGDDMGPGYVEIKRVQFGPDSDQLVYAARDDDGAFMVLDGKKSKTFGHLPGEPVFSRDGERLAYAVAEQRRGDVRMRIVVDGETGPAFHRIGAYLFSPDGKQFAYMAVDDDEKAMMVNDGEVSEAYDSIGKPVFAPNGNHLAYAVYRKESAKWAVKKDGEKGPAFDVVEDPVFCPKGDRMAYLVQDGDRFMVVEDGDIEDSYDWAEMVDFSPDGEHLVYAAAEEGEAFLVVDGQKGEERFLSFVRGARLVFTEDNTVQGIAARALADGSQEFWQIRAEIEK